VSQSGLSPDLILERYSQQQPCSSQGKFDARFRAHYSDFESAHIGRSKTQDCLTWLYLNYAAGDLDEANITQGVAEAADAVSRQLPATSKEVVAHEKSSKLQAGTVAITVAMKNGGVHQIMQSIRSFQRIVNGERFKTRTGSKCIITGGIDVEVEPTDMTRVWSEELALTTDKKAATRNLIANFNMLAEMHWQKMTARGVLQNMIPARMPISEPSFLAKQALMWRGALRNSGEIWHKSFDNDPAPAHARTRFIHRM
jgi:archaellum component FlaG (FlaF/FlaG flagellin family)